MSDGSLPGGNHRGTINDPDDGEDLVIETEEDETSADDAAADLLLRESARIVADMVELQDVDVLKRQFTQLNPDPEDAAIN